MKKIFSKLNMQYTIDSMEAEAKELLEHFKKIQSESGKYEDPKLAIITIGNDMASEVYVKNKIKKCREFGIDVSWFIFKDSTYLQKQLQQPAYYSGANPIDFDPTLYAGNLMYQEIVEVISKLKKKKIPLLIQLPMDTNILSESQKESITSLVPDNLDVDCFNDGNIGKLIKRNPYIMPCTVYGIMQLIKNFYNGEMDLRNKKVCVLGRSSIVGFPLMMQLIANNAKINHINSTHSKEDLMKALEDVDIIVSAVGKHGVISDEDLYPIALQKRTPTLLIDVGINRNEDLKLVGDFKLDKENILDPEERPQYTVFYSPVPGGVGKLTVLGVVINTLKLSLLNMAK